EEAKAEAKPVVADGTPRAPSQESKDAAAEVRNRQAPRGPRGQGGPGGGQGGSGGGNRRPGGPGGQGGGHGKRRRSDEPEQSEYTEKVVQVRRVTKVVKGGKKLSFRVSVIIGNEKGKVGVGVGKAAEVLIAIKKAISDAKKKIVEISTTGSSISHTVYGIAGGSKVLLKPAGDGTGIIAGGTARIVLELAGVGDILAKSQGSKSSLNVARATIEALQQLRSFKEVAAIRGLSIKEMLF
ncbi:MAG: 30S ribosomal protein S5, partial [Candidatus Melainabacteria bacterium]|nr:30S ribosomal protein S5 [Candidatus Melainabacteria bacterium]